MLKLVRIFGFILTVLIAESFGRQPSVDKLPAEEPINDDGLLNSQEDLIRNISITSAQPQNSENHIYETTDNTHPGNQEDLSRNSSTTSEQPPSSQENIYTTTDIANPSDQENLVDDINTTTEYSPFNNSLEEISSTTDSVQPEIKKLIHIKDVDDLSTKLQEAGEKLVLIFFVAKWCVHSRRIEPIVIQVATEMSDKVFVYKVDVDDQYAVSKQYNVYKMPTFVFVRNNTKLEEFSGANENKLWRTVQKYI